MAIIGICVLVTLCNCVCVHQLINRCAGDTPITLNGVLQYFRSPSNRSLLSAEAFFKMHFAICTTYSAAPFDWVYSGELVV